jgi:iron complex outermembrane receptor protein
MKLKMKSMPLAIFHVIASGALSAIVMNPAMAQQAAVSAAEPQRVVVTGSLISRADKETPSPVQVLTADDLAKTGYTTVAEVLSNITSNGAGALSQSFSGAFASGGSGVSLRGLTVGVTLVLIDGHRMAPYPLSDDGQRAFVDVSSIPFDAVERIEVLKDGASSVYGSDAIAGVVNIILKKTFLGTNLKADTGTSQHGGGRTVHFAATHGFGDLNADGYNAFASLEYRHGNPIKVADRDRNEWANGDWTSRGGINLTRGVVNAQNGGRVAASVPFFYDQTATQAAGGVLNAANFAFVSPECDFVKYRAGGCAVRDTVGNIAPETEHVNFLAGFTKKLGGDWKLSTKASVFDSKDSNNRGLPATYSAGSFGGNTALVPGQAPKIVNVIPSFLAPATYPGNPYGKAVRIYGYIPEIAPANSTVIRNRSERLAFDLSGTVAGWDMNAALGYTNVTTKITYDGYINRPALYAAIIRPVNPWKIGGGNTAADLAAVAPTFRNEATDTLKFAELRGSRELMELSGGALGLAIGASYTDKKLSAPSPLLLQTGTVGNGGAYAFGQEKNSAAFFELIAPVLKNLELDLSGRFDHFDTFGNSKTPKAGFKFTPSPMLTLRGTYSKGFRAPNAAENGTAGSSFSFAAIDDPILCKDGNPKTAGNVVAACNFTPGFVQVTTKDLQPEKSKSTTFGLILEPVKGWSTTVDYYKIQIDGQINTASGLPGFVPDFVRTIPLPTPIADGNGGTVIATPAVGQVAYATSGYVNAGSTKTSGVELDTTYKFKLGEMGSLKTTFSINHMISYEVNNLGVSYELAGTHGPSIVGGSTGNPKNRAQASIGWDKGALNLTTNLNWVSSFSVLDPSIDENDCDSAIKNVSGRAYFFNTKTPPAQYCHIPSFLTTDVTATYKVGKNWVFYATVLNLFDRAPPIDTGTYGNASNLTSYNPALHQSGAVGRFFKGGVSYSF